MSDLTPAEKRAVEAALAILQRPEDHQPLTNRLMLERNMAYHERTAVYGYLAGDRDGYRRGVEAERDALRALLLEAREALVPDNGSIGDRERFEVGQRIDAALRGKEGT